MLDSDISAAFASEGFLQNLFDYETGEPAPDPFVAFEWVCNFTIYYILFILVLCRIKSWRNARKNLKLWI